MITCFPCLVFLGFSFSASAYLQPFDLRLRSAMINPRVSLVQLSSQSSRRRFVMQTERVPFIAGNWKMNPDTVDQVCLLQKHTI